MKITSVVLNTILIRSIFQFIVISLLTPISNINLKEFLILKKFHIIKSYQEISFKNFSFQLIPTTHSIPDPTGIFFKTNDGNIYHTGDWKIDKNPVTGDPFDYDNFKILKDESIDLLIGDSTNAGVKEISRSESELDPSFDRLFDDLNGRIIVTCFSSILRD